MRTYWIWLALLGAVGLRPYGSSFECGDARSKIDGQRLFLCGLFYFSASAGETAPADDQSERSINCSKYRVMARVFRHS